MIELKNSKDFRNKVSTGDIFISISRTSNSHRISKVIEANDLNITREVISSNDGSDSYNTTLEHADWNFYGWIFYLIEDEKELEDIDAIKSFTRL